ncbi:hypothetical protein [Winogradskyella marincola]|uniref:Lipoprotein n=1 Tax=Winogradskyella marincola TaxID=3037795 RepID=A0ABT6G4F3_9FLAO|nr:hypothetical protein [Winogradskyella sp. YYF002]MDG4716923.1 hypothetical protein [Winogradskyella sp. YYF002]
MKRVFFCACILIGLLSSCTSNNNDIQPEDSNFYALTVGNLWEYRWFAVGNEGNENPMDLHETISIIGMEEINGYLYYKFSRTITGNFNGNYGFVPENGEHFEYYRDSLGYLVNSEGEIKFSYNPTVSYVTETFGGENDNDTTGIAELQSANVDYTTEAGTFDCLELIVSYVRDNGFIYPAKNRVYYSDGIGLVKDDNVFLSAETAGYYRKLQSYSFQ